MAGRVYSNKEMKKYLLHIAVTLWLLISLLYTSGILQSIDNKIFDYSFLYRPSIPISQDIVTIDIDDPAIESIGRWPWNWSIHSLMFEHLHKHNVGYLFVIDMDFSEIPQITITTEEESLIKQKNILSEIIQQRNPYNLIKQLERMNDYVYFSSITRLKGGTLTKAEDLPGDTQKDTAPVFLMSESIIEPHREIQQNIAGVGTNAITFDSDGVVRRYPLFVNYKGEILPSIVIKAVSAIKEVDKIDLSKETIKLYSKNKIISIPVNKHGEVTINWTGKYSGSFVHIPFNLLSSFIIVDHLKDSLKGVNLAQLNNPMAILDYLVKISNSKGILNKEQATAKATIVFLAFLMDYYFANTGHKPEEILQSLGLDVNNKDFLHMARQIFINNLAVKQYLFDGKILEFDELIKKNQITLSSEEQGIVKDSYNQMVYYINHSKKIEDLRPLYFEQTKILKIDGKEFRINPTFLHGKVVFYGLTATGLTSQNPSPFMERHPMLDLVPQVVNTIITGSFIREIPSYLMYPIFAIYILVILFVAFRYKPIIGLAITLLIASLHCLITWTLFSKQGIVITVSTPLVSLFLPYSMAVFLRYFDEYRERMKVKKIFSTMVSPEVLKIMVQRKDSLSLAGEIKDATVFSSDVSGFTTISEGVTAQELARILNVYLSSMSNIIMSFDGYVDKYEGDAIKAVFGAPLEDSNHHYKACYSALLQQEELKIIQKMILIKYGVNITARMGINSGLVYAGNMGSKKRIQYTVMGETVRIAEELEPANKLFDTWISAGQETVLKAGQYIKSRYLGEVSISDSHKIKAYEVIGWNKDKYINHWAQRPIPELLLESFTKISPERIIASINYYSKINYKESGLLQYIISFYETLRDDALTMLKIDAMISYSEIDRQIENLKKSYQIKETEETTFTDQITHWKNQIKALNKAILEEVTHKQQKEQLFIQIDNLSKSIERFSKRLKIDSSDDDNIKELVDYLRLLIDGKIEKEDEKLLIDKFSSLEVKIQSKAQDLVKEIRNRSLQYHQLTAQLCG